MRSTSWNCEFFVSTYIGTNLVLIYSTKKIDGKELCAKLIGYVWFWGHSKNRLVMTFDWLTLQPLL
jgi:hypothetical protein